MIDTTRQSDFISKAMNLTTHLDTPNNRFWDGFQAHCEGQPLEDMPSADQERGWFAGNAAQGEAETDEYADDIADRQFWATGGW